MDIGPHTLCYHTTVGHVVTEHVSVVCDPDQGAPAVLVVAGPVCPAPCSPAGLFCSGHTN